MGFQKTFEKSRVIDKGKHFSALLTDLEKTVLDCLTHDLIIAKLDAYDFKNEAFCLIFNYLKNKKQSLNKCIL